MNINLPDDLIEFVKNAVSTGDYASPSEVVGDALRLFRLEQAREREKLETIRRAIAVGMEDVAAGRFSSRTVDEIAEDVMKDHFGE